MLEKVACLLKERIQDDIDTLSPGHAHYLARNAGLSALEDV